MKKIFKMAMGCKVLLIAAMALMVSCAEDYGDEISALDDRLTAAEDSIDDLQAKINAGGLVTSVEETEDGFLVTFSGNVSEPIEILNGEKGEKGDDFEYEDFTDDQLEDLKGDKGDKGDDFEYEDFTDDQLEDLKGDKGDDGKDLTVGAITFRDMDDYGLFLIDALDESSKPRIIVVPMDVATPTSITMLTQKMDISLGGTTAFEVIVNPTENAKEITEFYFVNISGYSRSSSTDAYARFDGFEIEKDVFNDANGAYSLKVTSVSNTGVDADALFVAAKYEVNKYIGESGDVNGYVDAVDYTAVKSAETDAVYNKTSVYELISSTPITDTEFTYEPIVDADLVTIADVHIYEGETSAAFDLFAKFADVEINIVEDGVTSEVKTTAEVPVVTGNAEVTYDYESGMFTVSARVTTANYNRRRYQATVTVEDYYTPEGGVGDTDAEVTFDIYVYKKADLEVTSDGASVAFLPAVKDRYALVDKNTDYITATFSDLTAVYDYNFEEPIYSIEMVGDEYELASVGYDLDKYDPSDLLEVVFGYDDVSEVYYAEYKLKANNEDESVLLLPGVYAISVTGTAMRAGDDTAETITVELKHTIDVQSPQYTIEVQNLVATAVSPYAANTYMAVNWKDFTILSNLIAANTTTVSHLTTAPYTYEFNKEGDNVVTTDGVRALVGGVSATTVTFPSLPQASKTSEFSTKVQLYYELTTGVKFPVKMTDDDATYSDVTVAFAEIKPSGVDFKGYYVELTSGRPGDASPVVPIPYYVDDSGKTIVNPASYKVFYNWQGYQYTSSIDSSETNIQKDRLATSSSYVQSETANSRYNSLTEVVFSLDKTLEISESGTGDDWAEVTADDPNYGVGFLEWSTADGAVDGDIQLIEKDLNWQANTSVIYRQKVSFVATDCFGQTVSDFYYVQINKMATGN